MNTKKNQLMWIDKIHENLLLRGRSEKTFENYKCALKRFFNFYDVKTNIKCLNEEDITIYLKKRILNKNMCSDTYNLSVAAIRLLFLVCFNKSLNHLLLPSCKTKKRIPTILPKDKFLTIINEENNLKHKCWLILAFCSGLRVDEIANLKIEDLSSKEHKIKVLGKGNKERYTILPNISIRIIAKYCKENNISSGPLFSGFKGRNILNSKTIINYFSVLKNTYNLPDNITFHSLRHSFATYYLANGGSLLALQSMLGHTNLNTTTIYLHLSQNFNELEGIKYV